MHELRMCLHYGIERSDESQALLTEQVEPQIDDAKSQVEEIEETMHSAIGFNTEHQSTGNEAAALMRTIDEHIGEAQVALEALITSLRLAGSVDSNIMAAAEETGNAIGKVKEHADEGWKQAAGAWHKAQAAQTDEGYGAFDYPALIARANDATENTSQLAGQHLPSVKQSADNAIKANREARITGDTSRRQWDTSIRKARTLTNQLAAIRQRGKEVADSIATSQAGDVTAQSGFNGLQAALTELKTAVFDAGKQLEESQTATGLVIAEAKEVLQNFPL